MLRFYGSLVRRTFSILWTATDRYVTIFGVVSFFALLLSPELTEIAESTWAGFSRWWALLPLGLLFAYGLMKANYEVFQEEQQKRERIEAGKDALQEKFTTVEKRRALKDLLGDAHKQGEDIYTRYDEDYVAEWVTRTYNLIEAALDRSEAQLFLSNRGGLPFTPVDDERTLHIYMQEQALGNRLVRLEELTNRLDSLTIRPDFKPQDWILTLYEVGEADARTRPS